MKATKATPELKAKADRLRREGCSYREIGKRIGVAPTTVQYWLDKDFAAMRRGDGRRP
jgi:transposase